MEAGHHRAAARTLHDHGLDIDGAIKRAQARAEQKQRGTEERHIRDQSEWRQGQAHQNRGGDDDAPATEPRGECAGGRHCEHRSHAEAKQQQSQPAFIQSGACLGEWHQRRPGGDAKTGDEERDAGGNLLSTPR
jgi:hypothetical protein